MIARNIYVKTTLAENSALAVAIIAKQKEAKKYGAYCVRPILLATQKRCRIFGAKCTLRIALAAWRSPFATARLRSLRIASTSYDIQPPLAFIATKKTT